MVSISSNKSCWYLGYLQYELRSESITFKFQDSNVNLGTRISLQDHAWYFSPYSWLWSHLFVFKLMKSDKFCRMRRIHRFQTPNKEIETGLFFMKWFQNVSLESMSFDVMAELFGYTWGNRKKVKHSISSCVETGKTYMSEKYIWKDWFVFPCEHCIHAWESTSTREYQLLLNVISIFTRFHPLIHQTIHPNKQSPCHFMVHLAALPFLKIDQMKICTTTPQQLLACECSFLFDWGGILKALKRNRLSIDYRPAGARTPRTSESVGKLKNASRLGAFISRSNGKSARPVVLVLNGQNPPAPEVQGAWSSGWHKLTKVQVYLGGGVLEKTSCFW